MKQVLWLAALWPLAFFPFLSDPTPNTARTASEVTVDTTYADDRYAALVPGITDTVIHGTDTFVMFVPDPDSVGTGVAYRAIRGGDSFIVLSYDTLVAEALDSSTVDSIWGAWGLGTPTAYAVDVPGNPAGEFVHEPSGFVAFTEMPFSDTVNGAADDWVRNNGTSGITLDATAPYTPDSVGYMPFEYGHVGGSGPDNWYFRNGISDIPDSVQSDSIYVAYWLKASDNFVGHPTGTNKVIFVTTDGITAGPLFTKFLGVLDDSLRYQISEQGTGLPNAKFPHEDSEEPHYGDQDTLARNTWYKIEHLFVLNTTASDSDGVVKTWIDGDLKFETDSAYLWSGAGGSRWWSGLKWNPIWGGTGSTLDTVVSGSDTVFFAVGDTMYQWIDHIYMSGNDNS